MGMDPLWAQVIKYHELCLDLPHKRQGSKPLFQATVILRIPLLQADLPIATDSSDSPAGSVSEHPCGLVPGDGGIVSGPAVLSCMSLPPLGVCTVSVDGREELS